jgi:putative transposase
MNIFLRELSALYAQDMVLLCCDGAAWHKSKALDVPKNIVIFHIPPYTPEMNPIEQIWKELRKTGFRNEVFASLDKVVDRLCDSICSLSAATIKCITCRSWIVSYFN